MIRDFIHFMPITLVAIALGCGGDSPTTVDPPPPPPTPQPQANLSVLVDPNPVRAVPSGDPEYPWQVDITVKIRETAGAAANINFINVELGDPIPPLNYGAGEIQMIAGRNRISANGSLDVPLSFLLSLSEGRTGGAGFFKVVVDCTDAGGERQQVTATAGLMVGSSATRDSLAIHGLRRRN